MAIKVGILSDDLDRQIYILREFPEILEKHFRNLMKADVQILGARIKPTIPFATGRARKTFKSKVLGKGINMEGRVGWWGSGQPWYINIVEYGAKPHPITAKKKKLLHFGNTSVKTVNHPGFSKRGFMAAGYSAIKPIIDADMAAAGENVVNELALK